jgi:hypothetical protein
MKTLFYVSTFQQTAWIINHMMPGGIPVLNYDAGDLVHESLEDACALGLDIAADPSVRNRGTDVLAIDILDTLYDELVLHGDIQEHSRTDALGARLLSVNREACRIINSNCTVATKRYYLEGCEPGERELRDTSIPPAYLN